MPSVIIKAKTEKGRKAIKQGLKESSLLQTQAVKQWYSVKQTRKRPLTLLVNIKLPFLSQFVVSAQLEDILTQNGAKKDVDYVLSYSEVVK